MKENHKQTVGDAVNVGLQALSNHLLTAVGKGNLPNELARSDGKVVSFSSVSHIMEESFDKTIIKGASIVLEPIKPHRHENARLGGATDSGVLDWVLYPFRPGPLSVSLYLRAELNRRADYFGARMAAIEFDWSGGLELQARQMGEVAALATLAAMTKQFKRGACAALWGW